MNLILNRKVLFSILIVVLCSGYLFAFRNFTGISENVKTENPNYKAFVVAPTSYVFKGEDYTAKIFLADLVNDNTEKIWMGGLTGAQKDIDGSFLAMKTNPVAGGHPLNIESGIGELKYSAGTTGESTYSGAIEIVENGVQTYYPFEGKYNVGDRRVNVDADKMNVLYVGVDNPITVSVPGFASDKIITSVSKGTLSTYYGMTTVKVDSFGAITISVAVKMPDGSIKEMGKKFFRAKRIPTPSIRLGSIQPGMVELEAYKAQTELIAYLADFHFDLKFIPKQADLTFIPANKDSTQHRHIAGADISSIKDLINKAQSGGLYLFSNVLVQMPNGEMRECTPVYYLIK